MKVMVSWYDRTYNKFRNESVDVHLLGGKRAGGGWRAMPEKKYREACFCCLLQWDGKREREREKLNISAQMLWIDVIDLLHDSQMISRVSMCVSTQMIWGR